MKTKGLLAVLDLIDFEFQKALINVNELRLFFPNERDESFKVGLSRQVKACILTNKADIFHQI